jgi:hypothetical protein
MNKAEKHKFVKGRIWTLLLLFAEVSNMKITDLNLGQLGMPASRNFCKIEFTVQDYQRKK